MWRIGSLLLALLLALTPASAQLAVTGVGGGFGAASGGGHSVVNIGDTTASGGGVTSVALTPLANAVAAGTPVILCAYSANGIAQSPSLTDSQSNTYSIAASLANGLGGVYIYYSFLTHSLGTGDTITFTDSASTGFGLFNISVIAGLGYTAHDAATDNSANDIISPYSLAGAGSAAVSNELYFGCVTNGNGATMTVDTPWVTNPPNSPSAQMLPATQVNTGTSALTFSGTYTLTGSVNAAIASFKP